MRLLLIIAAAGCASIAQVGQWPSELSMPGEAAGGDSSGTTWTSRQRLYDKSLRSTAAVTVQTNDSLRYRMQSAVYDLTFDHGAYNDVVNQYLDLSGCLARKQYPHQSALVGLEWKPVLMLNTKSGQDAGVFQGDLYAGPFAAMPLFWGIPLKLGVGGAGRTWNTAVADHLGRTRQSDFSAAGGFYGTGEMGDWSQPIGGFPLHFSAKGDARSLGVSERFIGGLGSLLFAQGLPTTDSAFVYVADSVINGKRASLSESAEGHASFVNTPSRIENSLRISAGLRLKPRLRFAPGVVYEYLDHSRQYPWTEQILSDVRRTQDHRLRFLLQTEDFLVDYRGGLGFTWGTEDWLFDRSVDSLAEMQVDINDRRTFEAQMMHTVTRDFVKGLGLGYRYSILRELRTYPTVGSIGRDTLRNSGDHDEVQQQHEVETHFVRTGVCSLSVSGALGSRLSRYLKKERSADNITDRMYKMGAALQWTPSDRLGFNERAGMIAEVSEYDYPSLHVDPDFDPAPYKRRFYSQLESSGEVCRRMGLKGEFDIRYDDNGYWNRREMYDSLYLDSVGSAFREYYAPQFRSWEVALGLAPVVHLFESFDVEAGGTLKYIRLDEYLDSTRGYVVDPEGGGYWLIPGIRFSDAAESTPWYFDGTVKAYVDLRRDHVRIDTWEVQLMLNVRL